MKKLIHPKAIAEYVKNIQPLISEKSIELREQIDNGNISEEMSLYPIQEIEVEQDGNDKGSGHEIELLLEEMAMDSIVLQHKYYGLITLA